MWEHKYIQGGGTSLGVTKARLSLLCSLSPLLAGSNSQAADAMRMRNKGNGKGKETSGQRRRRRNKKEKKEGRILTEDLYRLGRLGSFFFFLFCFSRTKEKDDTSTLSVPGRP